MYKYYEQYILAEPPGPPRGPLEVSGMTKTSFTIKWQAPENDGGTPITEYIIEIKEESKKTWQKVDKNSSLLTNIFLEIKIQLFYSH